MTIVIEINLLCDSCFEAIETDFSTEARAQQYADDKGWITQEETFHFCPNCKNEVEKSMKRIHRILKRNVK